MQSMRNKARYYLYALLLVFPVLCWAESIPGNQAPPERILWQKTPIELALSVGKEQRIDFPVPRVEVLAPTVTPSPTPSPTPTPTRGPTPVPTPIFLPLLQRGECLEKQRVDVVLVIDSSDSMLDDVGGGRNKLDLALEAAARFSELLDLPAGDAVALVHFNGEAAIDLPLSRNPAAVRAALARLPQAPGTRIDLGLQLAALALSGPERSPAEWRDSV